MTSEKYFHVFSLPVTGGQSWSLEVTRGHSWSFVVTRGHSWSLVRLDTIVVWHSIAKRE